LPHKETEFQWMRWWTPQRIFGRASRESGACFGVGRTPQRCRKAAWRFVYDAVAARPVSQESEAHGSRTTKREKTAQAARIGMAGMDVQSMNEAQALADKLAALIFPDAEVPSETIPFIALSVIANVSCLK
jgi:hypothetical protein